MDIISKVTLEIKKNDRVYRFEMPTGAPFGECYDAAFEALTKIAELAKEAAAGVKQSSEEPAQEVSASVN